MRMENLKDLQLHIMKTVIKKKKPILKVDIRMANKNLSMIMVK